MPDHDPPGRPTGDAVGGHHNPDTEPKWDWHRDQYGHVQAFRVYDLDDLAKEPPHE